jgi:hypothetical protein
MNKNPYNANRSVKEMSSDFFYRVQKLRDFRNTEKVDFYDIPLISGLQGIDLVFHKPLAFSPGSVGAIRYPWYCHTHQIDNLLVAHGLRRVELVNLDMVLRENFEVTPFSIMRLILNDQGMVTDRKCLCQGPGILSWSVGVFHRIVSGSDGSASINFAIQLPGFDIRTNFDVYNLDLETKTRTVIRRGEEDQH